MKHLKNFDEINELSRELINKTSDAMISKGQNMRAKKLIDTYNDANYDFSSFINKPIFNDEFIRNIKIKTEYTTSHPDDKKFETISVYISNNQEYNTSHSYLTYYINEDKWVGLPHKGEIKRQDARLLGKIAMIVNPDTKYKTGTGDIQIGEY